VLRRTPSGEYTWDENVLANFGLKELYGLYVEPDNTVWAAGLDSGLVRYDPSRIPPRKPVFQVLLRQVQVVGRERTVYGGAAPPSSRPKLPYRDDALHFDFSAPLFEGATEVEYRVFLQGLGQNWSPWTTQSEKEYTNIWEGSYTFHVQARDSHGRLSQQALFNFAVHPPFYRQWWAYSLYGLFALGFIWLLLRWRLLAVRAKNRKLESIIEQRTDEIRRQRDEIKLHEQETENLLLNILPASVAEELRTTGSVTPLCCDNITVCFTDFVKFTLSTETISPEELVDALNRYFSEFDRIVESYGLEKIKTIGDSYMFVSGLPGTKASHAVDAVLAALEIVAAVERLSATPPAWQVRVGLHSGPAVAGVVGLRKFAFDIWGETVNYASRHESSGEPNCVNISAQTYELIADFFQCRSRGPVLIKEGRSPEMYLVECVHHKLCRPLTAKAGYLFEDLYHRKFRTPPPKMPDLNKLAAAT
jgi:class 3 adenylate cyclase